MYVRRVGLALLVAAAATGTAAAQSQFHVTVQLVDPAGAGVTALSPAQTTVLESGVSAKVVKVEPLDGSPRVQLLLDNGSALGSANIGHLREGVRGFLEHLPPDVEVAIYTTAPQPRPLLKPTKDRAAQLKALGLLVPDSGTGRFVEAVSEAADRLAKAGGGAATIVCVATTAGAGEVPIQVSKELYERLGRARPTVHVVMLTSSQQNAVAADVAPYVAKSTGGRYETIVTSSTLTTFLPELGTFVAKTTAAKGGLFRLTVDRPSGAKGPLGKVSFGSAAGAVTKIVVEP